MIMRGAVFALLFGSSALIAVSALAQTGAPLSTAPATTARPEAGAADLCQELLAYAEKKSAESPEPLAGQASAPAAAPLPRGDEPATGTQGGGSVGPSTSTNTSSQAAAPPTVPVSSGIAPEAASSPHASGSSGGGAGAMPAGTPGPSAEFKLASGITVQQVRDTASGGDRQACRDAAQMMRYAGADLPAALIALTAYEPDPAKRQ
jgi:hypothetical protein